MSPIYENGNSAPDARDRETFEDMRRLVTYVRLAREEPAKTCAAMLSLLAKRERDGGPVPGYVELLEAAQRL